MKSFRHICLAIALMTTFSLPALADGGETQGPSGEITTPGNPGDLQTPGEPIPGEINTPGLAAAGEAHSPVWTVFLALPDLLF